MRHRCSQISFYLTNILFLPLYLPYKGTFSGYAQGFIMNLWPLHQHMNKAMQLGHHYKVCGALRPYSVYLGILLPESSWCPPVQHQYSLMFATFWLVPTCDISICCCIHKTLYGVKKINKNSFFLSFLLFWIFSWLYFFSYNWIKKTKLRSACSWLSPCSSEIIYGKGWIDGMLNLSVHLIGQSETTVLDLTNHKCSLIR